MPTIAIFYGISVRMYYDDHNPPHIHVYYVNQAAKFTIESGALIAGNVPGRVESMVREWTLLNKVALLENWQRSLRHEPLLPVAPLE